MSKQMKMVLAVVLVLALGGGAYYQFVYSKADPVVDATGTPGTVGGVDCVETGSTTTPPADSTGVIPPPADSTGVTPPPADPAAGTAPAGDPAAVTPAPAAMGSGDDAVVAAGDSSDASYTSDGVLRAAADPNAVTPVTTDPAADPAAGGAPTEPSTNGGAADPTAVADPCADVAGGGVDPGAAGAGTTPGGTGAPATPAGIVSDGQNTGNVPDALSASKLVAGIAQKNQLIFTVETTLLPAQAGSTTPMGKALGRYRKSVTAAALRIKIADEASMQQWSTSPAKTRKNSVQSFLKLLGRLYPNATRSVSMVSTTDSLVAVGDAAPGAAGRVKIVG